MEEYRRLCRWEDNIKMDLKEIGVDMMSWMEIAHWTDFVNTALNLQSISSQLCYVTVETIWKNTGGFVDERTILRWFFKKWMSM